MIIPKRKENPNILETSLSVSSLFCIIAVPSPISESIEKNIVKTVIIATTPYSSGVKSLDNTAVNKIFIITVEYLATAFIIVAFLIDIFPNSSFLRDLTLKQLQLTILSILMINSQKIHLSMNKNFLINI